MIPENSPRYLVWPMLYDSEIGAYTVTDQDLACIWSQLVAENRVHNVFWGGTIREFPQFLNFFRNPAINACVVVDSVAKKVVFLAWLSDYNGTYAFGHFVALGKYRAHILGGKRISPGDAVLDYWRYLQVKVVVGVTPSSNEKAVKFIKMLGFKEVGEIPNTIHLVYEERYVAGKISYIEI